MFIGHYAVGFAAKRLAPKTSLGTLFLSVQLVDLLWPIFLLLGLESVRIDPGNTVVTPLDFYDYSITHSLVGALGWSLLLGLIYFVARRFAPLDLGGKSCRPAAARGASDRCGRTCGVGFRSVGLLD